MNCIRCGRNTANQQVFCDHCLENMTRYPVKSDAPIHLPVHKPKAPPAKPNRRKKELSPEETVVLLQKRFRRLLLSLIAVLLVLALLLGGIVYTLLTPERSKVPDKLGQNYQTADSTPVATFNVSGD